MISRLKVLFSIEESSVFNEVNSKDLVLDIPVTKQTNQDIETWLKQNQDEAITVTFSFDDPSVLDCVNTQDLPLELPVKEKTKREMAEWLLQQAEASKITDSRTDNIQQSSLTKKQQRDLDFLKSLVREKIRLFKSRNYLTVYLVPFSLAILASCVFLPHPVLIGVVKPLLLLNLLVFYFYFRGK
jgi:hypothetical protein